jgi:flagellar hook protein FlgE
MLTSINIGTSGLVGFSKELETISNNVANLNTPGFKGGNTPFSSMFDAGAGTGAPNGGANRGAGLATLPTVFDFSQGQINQTASDLDVAIDGSGFFVLKDSAGKTSYTRDGRFSFDKEGLLVAANGDHVQGLRADGTLHDVSVADVRTNPAKATTEVTLSGNLSGAEAGKTVSGVQVFDSAGAAHTLSLEFRNNNAAAPGSWLVTVKEGETTIGSGEVRFNAGQLDPAAASVVVEYAPEGAAPTALSFSIAAGATSPATGISTLAVSKVDGYGTGQMTKATFDAEGKLVISYSNGQTGKEQTLALAEFATTASLQPASGTSYITTDPSAVRLGTAGGGTASIDAGSLEGSNVDLSKQFSAIIITQRGYQASSELISTANEMLDTLMRMKG